MEALKNGIELTGTLYTSAQGDAKDKLAYAEQIWDDELKEFQSEINKRLIAGGTGSGGSGATTIKENDNYIISEMTVDTTDSDDSIEVYTKQLCDERFVRIWLGTLEEYDAIPVKDNTYLYIILT